MNFLTKLFKKKPVVEIPPRPSWETVVEMMYDKYLDAFSKDPFFTICFTFKSVKIEWDEYKKEAWYISHK